MIVIARGGGSVEDLLPFSDEALVRAVADARTPVVSAIGHEPDTPLLDLVADVRASTPTDAAKLVVPDVAEERAGSPAPARRLHRARRRALAASGATWSPAQPARAGRPDRVVAARRQEVDALRDRARRRLQRQRAPRRRRDRAPAGAGPGPVPAGHAGARLRRGAARRRPGGHATAATSRRASCCGCGSPAATSASPGQLAPRAGLRRRTVPTTGPDRSQGARVAPTTPSPCPTRHRTSPTSPS